MLLSLLGLMLVFGGWVTVFIVVTNAMFTISVGLGIGYLAGLFSMLVGWGVLKVLG